MPCYERWTVAFANILFAKGPLTPTELAQKMREVEARFAAAARRGHPGAFRAPPSRGALCVL
ncbi:hypothetical protein [Paroceanicella profunda]|uniref:hypothetical protein n=1 Tax=Paroceanicella profunda TaxID=2579971 RepID=UPI00321196E6